MVDWGGDMYQHERFADFLREASNDRLASFAARSSPTSPRTPALPLKMLMEGWWRHRPKLDGRGEPRMYVLYFQ